MAQAKAELGYAPRTTFEDGIARTVAWYRDDYWPQFGATFAADLLGQSRLGLGLGGLGSGSSSNSSFDGPPTEELEQWPGGAERRARSLSGSLAADQDEPTAAAAKAEQRRLRRLLPRTLPRALPPAATALLASLHLDVRTRAQVTKRPTQRKSLGLEPALTILPLHLQPAAPRGGWHLELFLTLLLLLLLHARAQAAALTPARTADGDDAANARALNAHSWAGGDFGEGLPPPLPGGPARDDSARPAVHPHTFDEPIEF